MERKIKVVVVDGQGGGIGGLIVEKIKAALPELKIRALGTNSLATQRMMRAGADEGATGENALIYNVKDADVILGVVAILMPNAMMGELSPKMAEAIGASPARKILIPMEKCNLRIAVPGNYGIQACADQMVELLKRYLAEEMVE